MPLSEIAAYPRSIKHPAFFSPSASSTGILLSLTQSQNPIASPHGPTNTGFSGIATPWRLDTNSHIGSVGNKKVGRQSVLMYRPSLSYSPLECKYLPFLESGP